MKRLHELNVDVKILTGDNEIITAYICRQVGMPVENLCLAPKSRLWTRLNSPKRSRRPASLPRLVPGA